MTTDNTKYLLIAYKGKSFSVEEQVFYPLKSPMDFILSIDKTSILIGDQNSNVVDELERRMERDDAELWLTGEGIVVTLMSNPGGTKIVKLKERFDTDILSFNGIYLNENF
jgi:hypothetical protein